MGTISIDIPDEVHARLKMIAAAEARDSTSGSRKSLLRHALMNKRYSKCSRISETIVSSPSTNSMHRLSALEGKLLFLTSREWCDEFYLLAKNNSISD